VTQTGTVLGTSNYLSPEQAAGAPVTPASDIYSLGVVLYELLAGEVPFRGDNLVVVAMKHVTEHPPNLLDQRPDVLPRLARAVEHALEKEPDRRFASMDAFANELRRCRDELGGFDADRTMITNAPPVVAPPIRRRRRSNRAPLVLAVAGLVLLAVVVSTLVFGGPAVRGNHHGGAAGSLVPLQGVGDYDPQGDGGEHGYTAHLATDGNQATHWETERYTTRRFGGLKSGLGLVLDAGKTVKLARLTVTSTTPGFTAVVRSGSSPNGPFSNDSVSQTVQLSTTYTLNGAAARYYVLWITELPPGDYAWVSEVTGRI
jgi:serine/threonine-protein kinase